MNPHRTDAVSFTFGVVFLLAAALWLLAYLTPVPLPALGWIAVGGIGILGMLGVGLAVATRRGG